MKIRKRSEAVIPNISAGKPKGEGPQPVDNDKTNTNVDEDDLKATIADVLAVYPWMADYPVRCHLRCARREIDEEYGPDAAKAWGRYESAYWMLTGERAGAVGGPEQ